MYQNLLNNAARSGTLEELKAIWNGAPAQLHSDETLLIHYVGHLRDQNAADDAEVLLRGALNQHWSDKLVVGYGEMGRGDVSTQLEAAEGWLQQHEKDPYLLLTLGRLAKRAHQLEKARGYFEKSVKLLPSPDAYQELGDVLEQMDDKENATQCYRTGLSLLTGQPEAKKTVELIPAGGTKELAKGEKPADTGSTPPDESRQASA
jgi:HemY protein